MRLGRNLAIIIIIITIIIIIIIIIVIIIIIIIIITLSCFEVTIFRTVLKNLNGSVI